MWSADVIVDRDVWGLDRPFTYLVPEKLEKKARLGSIVRIPLRGRRVRGWIVGLSEPRDPEGLELIAMVSGPAPVFDEQLLLMARRLSRRYVHPLSSFLSLFTPPRMSRGRRDSKEFPDRLPVSVSRASGNEVLHAGASFDAIPHYLGLVERAVSDGRGAIVCVPEVREGSIVLEALEKQFAKQAAVVHSGIEPAERSSRSWDVALGKRTVVLGGRSAVFCPPLDAAEIIIHSEHDRSYKEQRAPYYSAVVAAAERAKVTGAHLLLASRTPSLTTIAEARAEGWPIDAPQRESERRMWPTVELLEPSKAIMPRRAVAAIIEARRVQERTIVLLPRTESTASGPGPRRLADYLSRVVPGARITRADRPTLGEPGHLKEALSGDVIIATEAALAEIQKPQVSTAIALGLDALLKRPMGRSVEDAFQTLWELGCLVSGRSPRGRLLLETERQDHYVAQALTRGDYRYFADRELEVRRRDDSPPFTTLLRLQVAGEPGEETIDKLSELPGATLLGPAEGRFGSEMMLKVQDLERILDPLRQIVASAPERILVEVDPREW